MALTPEEKSAVINCKYFGKWWGSEAEGLCPSGIVAQMRGVKFFLPEGDPDKVYCYDLSRGDEVKIIWDSVDDVAEWLKLTRRSYLDALESEGKDILNRAKD